MDLSSIKILKDNEVYRVADALGFNPGEKFTTEFLQNPEYEGTILNKYFANFRGNKYDHELLYRCCKEYAIDNSIYPYGEGYVLLHLRTGDDFRRRGLENPDNLRFYKEQLDEYTNKKVVIVTAMHFGHKDGPSKWYGNGGANIYTDEKYERNIKLLEEFFGELDKDVEICSNLDIDKDLCYLVFSRNVIVSPYAGGFAKLIITLREIHNG
jgi:hypothetical protein